MSNSVDSINSSSASPPTPLPITRTTPSLTIITPNNSSSLNNIMSTNNNNNNYNNNNNNNSAANINGGSLSPSTSIHNFSLLNDIYFQNTNDVNELINKSSHGYSISAGSIANINSGTSSHKHANNSSLHGGKNSTTSPSSSSPSAATTAYNNNNLLFIGDSGSPGYDVDLIVQTTKQEDSKFMGKKKRRNSSVSKVFLGDFLRLSNNVSILKMISKYGDNIIHFSDVLIKVNKRNKMQERIIIITDKSIYNVDPKDYKLKRRISLENVTSLSMSTMEDNFIILHVNSEYDYVLVGGRKIEIATVLLESYHRLTFYQITPYNIPITISPSSSSSTTTTTTTSNNISIPSSPSPSSDINITSTSTSPTNNNNPIASSSSSPSSKFTNTILKSVGIGGNNNNLNDRNSISGNNSRMDSGSIIDKNNNNNNGILTSNNSNVSVIHRITGSVLPVNLTDRIEYRIEGDSLREIIFTRVKGQVNISIQNVKSKPILKRELSRTSNLPNSPNASIK